jgi:hypothetical protein
LRTLLKRSLLAYCIHDTIIDRLLVAQ